MGGTVDTSSNLLGEKMWKMKQKDCPQTDANYPIAKMYTNRDKINPTLLTDIQYPQC